MTLATLLKATTALLAAALLAGCQATSFEKPPIADAGCDPALAGTWLSQDEDPGKEGEVVLLVDASCRLHVEEHEVAGVKRGDGVQAHLGRHGKHHYVWVDARWMHARFNEPHAPPAGDVYLLRYLHEGEMLTIWSTDDKPIAHAILDGELKGEVIASDSQVFNRLTGEPGPDVLERPGLFRAEPTRFRRQQAANP